MSTTNMYKYVHDEVYDASKIAQPIAGTGFVDIVGSDGVTPIAYSAISLFDDALGTTELVIDVDYEVGSADARYTALESSTVYRQVRILNASYQSAVFYADFSAVGGYVTRETFLDGDNTYSGDNTFSGNNTMSASAIFTGNMLVSGSSLFTGVSPQTASAWVNFNGTGVVAIRDDYNVSSITDNGTGLYTVNIDIDLDNTNFVIVSTGGEVCIDNSATTARAAGTAQVRYFNLSGTATDAAWINVIIFGGKA